MTSQTRACVARVNLPVIRATLRLRYSSTEMVDLAILTGAKTASDMVITKERERKRERKKERKREREEVSKYIADSKKISIFI